MFSKRRIAQLSFFFLRRSFFAMFSRSDASQPSYNKPTAVRAVAPCDLTNEVDRTNILAPGL